MSFLYLIPARRDSERLPGKNKKLLAGIPLVSYTLQVALELSAPEDICLTTNDMEIMDLAVSMGLVKYFIRPERFSTSQVSSEDVIRHALAELAGMGKEYRAVILLQPTSPFRNARHVKEAKKQFSADLDMVVSVKEAALNPDREQFLEENASKLVPITREVFEATPREQMCYEKNGAIYIISTASIKSGNIGSFKKIKKYEMTQEHSLDIDTVDDWNRAEHYLQTQRI